MQATVLRTLKANAEPFFKDSARSRLCPITSLEEPDWNPKNELVSERIFVLSSPRTCDVRRKSFIYII